MSLRQVLHFANSDANANVENGSSPVCHHKHNVKVDVVTNIDANGNATFEQGLRFTCDVTF